MQSFIRKELRLLSCIKLTDLDYRLLKNMQNVIVKNMISKVVAEYIRVYLVSV